MFSEFDKFAMPRIEMQSQFDGTTGTLAVAKFQLSYGEISEYVGLKRLH
jgi:hypothetical protein